MLLLYIHGHLNLTVSTLQNFTKADIFDGCDKLYKLAGQDSGGVNHRVLTCNPISISTHWSSVLVHMTFEIPIHVISYLTNMVMN